MVGKINTRHKVLKLCKTARNQNAYNENIEKCEEKNEKNGKSTCDSMEQGLLSSDGHN